MRRLVCAVALSMGMLMGCGGTTELDTPETIGTVEQGLACTYPDYSCRPGQICVFLESGDEGLCRLPCPSSGVCSGGNACRVTGGVPHC